MEVVIKNLLVNAGDIRVAGSIPGSGRSLGGEHGNPLHYSSLENPMDRGAWWAAVHRVTQSRTWLKWLNTHTRVFARGYRIFPFQNDQSLRNALSIDVSKKGYFEIISKSLCSMNLGISVFFVTYFLGHMCRNFSDVPIVPLFSKYSIKSMRLGILIDIIISIGPRLE